MNRFGLFVTVCLASAPAFGGPYFQAARPVWPEGRETEMNLTVGYRAAFEAAGAETPELRLAASSLYRVWLNGEFLGCGPARGPKYQHRVDTLDLAGHLKEGTNLLAVEVAGYNVNSFYLFDQPAFLQAEIAAGGRVLAATGPGASGFVALVPGERVQKAQRYSFQRTFSEVYRLAPGFDAWRRDPEAAVVPVPLAAQPAVTLLPRHVLYPDYVLRHPVQIVGRGVFEKTGAPVRLRKDRSLTQIGPQLKGFPEDELEVIPGIEIQQYASRIDDRAAAPFDPARPLALEAGHQAILDLGVNVTGFHGALVTCRKPARLWFTFDEILSPDGDVTIQRLPCVNLTDWHLQPGTYRIECIEPYTQRYLKLMCVEGAVEVSRLYVREYAHPSIPQAAFRCSDERLNALYAAGVQTFRQNALDVFMDCPSRERAGWLCDSFFTARVEADLMERSRVEHNFIENYLRAERFEHLPEGMLPMCYPADQYNGNFIPNWAMWFVVQLEEYLQRSGDRATVDALRPRLEALHAYFRRFENADGLLEKLEKWVFVEWSEANKFVQDVNYPSNMLYAGMLAAMGRMYDRPDLLARAGAIHAAVRKQSYDGAFFVDNAVRTPDGALEVTRNRTEVCQYFAFYFGTATPESHPVLWNRLLDEFGPDRAGTERWKEIHPPNMLVGIMLRLELLSRAGRCRQILDESVASLYYMAERTGTLWEHTRAQASCNHGFASHAVHTLYRDVLGLARVDAVGRTVEVRFGDAPLEHCEGAIPVPEGLVSLRWERRDGKLHYGLDVPHGYKVNVDNRSGVPLVREPVSTDRTQGTGQ